MDAKLKTGDVTQQVVVSGEASPLIDTASASEGQTFNTQKLQDLPNLGRNPFVFEKLDNNATPTGDPRFVRAEDQSGTTSISVAGAPVGSTGGANAANNYVVNEIQFPLQRAEPPSFPRWKRFLTQKSKQIHMTRRSGRSGGDVFNTTLKSGSSSYHSSSMAKLAKLTGRQMPGLITLSESNGLIRPLIFMQGRSAVHCLSAIKLNLSITPSSGLAKKDTSPGSTLHKFNFLVLPTHAGRAFG